MTDEQPSVSNSLGELSDTVTRLRQVCEALPSPEEVRSRAESYQALQRENESLQWKLGDAEGGRTIAVENFNQVDGEYRQYKAAAEPQLALLQEFLNVESASPGHYRDMVVRAKELEGLVEGLERKVGELESGKTELQRTYEDTLAAQRATEQALVSYKKETAPKLDRLAEYDGAQGDQSSPQHYIQLGIDARQLQEMYDQEVQKFEQEQRARADSELRVAQLGAREEQSREAAFVLSRELGKVIDRLTALHQAGSPSS